MGFLILWVKPKLKNNFLISSTYWNLFVIAISKMNILDPVAVSASHNSAEDKKLFQRKK